MDELIPKKDISLDYYRHLIMERDGYAKEARKWEFEYDRTFGDYIVELFGIKIECIRQKKTIAYYQRAINKGGVINSDELNQYLRQEMAEYEANLQNMIKSNNEIKDSKRISPQDTLKIKKLYHRLAKRVHPDINPLFKNDPEKLEIWQRIVFAYQTNNLKELEELEVIVDKITEGMNIPSETLVIPDLSKKISQIEDEISRITNTNPYLFKFLLKDTEATKDKIDSYKEEIKSYKRYSEELKTIIQTMLTSGDITIWQMN